MSYMLEAPNPTRAAEMAGSKRPGQTAWDMLKRPRVQKAIAEKQLAMVKQSGKQLAKSVTITRNDIINRLDKISEKAESEAARVSALGHLVTIFGLNPKHADTDLFAGWTDEELESYRATGTLPPRFRQIVGQSESDAGDSSPSVS